MRLQSLEMQMSKWIVVFCTLIFFAFVDLTAAHAGWVNGYWKKDGAYVPGYWRTNPNGIKFDNYSFDGDWSDAFNDSYFSANRRYSSDWYKPSWLDENDYDLGDAFYQRRQSYKQYSYDSLDYDYDFREDDPLYDDESSAREIGGFDRDLDNDNFSDYKAGGFDRDLDNDNFSDYGGGGFDRDLDNDNFSDYGAGGFDKDLDNDGFSDYGAGEFDRDLDNDNFSDYGAGGFDRDLDNDGFSDNY